jgi:phage shock protein E
MGFFSNLFGGGASKKALATLINDKNTMLCDVRSPDEFASGHVIGSVNIPVNQIENHLAKFKDKKEIVVYCRSGMRSSQAKSILKSIGFNNVTNAGTWNKVESLKV